MIWEEVVAELYSPHLVGTHGSCVRFFILLITNLIATPSPTKAKSIAQAMLSTYFYPRATRHALRATHSIHRPKPIRLHKLLSHIPHHVRTMRSIQLQYLTLRTKIALLEIHIVVSRICHDIEIIKLIAKV